MKGSIHSIPPAREGSEGPSKRILVVEDDESTAFILNRRLTKGGYEVTLVSTAEEALQRIRVEPYDLILSDLMMPGMSGYDLCRMVKGQDLGRSMQVILISARDETEAIVRGLDAGADDYIAKPFDPDELLARVRTQLRIKDLQDKLLEAEKHKIVGELAGAAAHEINQPLTILMGYAEMLAPLLEEDQEAMDKLEKILQSAEEIAAVVRRIQEIRGYKTKPYIADRYIVDLGHSGRGE